MNRMHELMIQDINENLIEYLDNLDAQYIREIERAGDKELNNKHASILNAIYLNACLISDKPEPLCLYSLMLSQILDMKDINNILPVWQLDFLESVSKYTDFPTWLLNYEAETIGIIYNYCSCAEGRNNELHT